MKTMALTMLMMCGLGTCWSQTSTGGISGQIVDAQHAAIPEAKVVIRNVETNASISLASNAVGLYSVTSLPAGRYSITVTKQGFDQVDVSAVSVNIASTSKVDVVMPPGRVEATVRVDAAGQLLTPDNPTITTVIPNKIAAGLPYPQQSAMEVVTLVPGVQGDPQYDMGVQSEDPPIYTQPTSTAASLSVGGGRPGSTEQLVDGFDVTMIGYPRAGITFSGYSINQLTVQDNGISAQYGRTGGGIINQSTASGTDQYHGLVAWRHYDPFFEANTYGQSGTRQHVQQNIFAGTLGGPVPLPRLKKDTFFFVSYEPLRGSSRVYSRIRVPTPDELAGNFQNSYTILNTSILKSSGYAAAVAAPRVGGLYYHFPLNTAGFPVGVPYNSSSQYVPIPGNNVSAQLAQNSLAQYIFSFFPTPQKPTPYIHYFYPDASYANDGNNALGDRGVVNSDNRYNIRVDHTFKNSDRMFARYTDVPVRGTRYAFLGPESPLNDYPNSIITSENGVLDYAHVFGNNRVNDARASYLRMDYEIQPSAAGLTQDYAKKLGLTPAAEGSGFPDFGIDTGTYGSSTGGNDGGKSINEAFAFGDDFSLLIGKHTVTVGGEFRALQLNRLNNSNLYGGNYSFSQSTTNNGSSGGNASATFILGEISSLGLAVPQTFYYRWKYGAAYIQDDWKITPTLTLNLGLRYNLETPRTEKYGLQGTFEPNVTGSLNNVPATGGFVFSGHNGLSNTLWPTNYKGFEPRVGFALEPRPSMTVRGSFGLTHTPLTGVTNSVIPPLTSQALNLGAQFGGQNPQAWLSYVTNPVSLPNGIPGILKPPSPLFSYGTGYLPYVSQTNAVPYVENWSLSVQYQLSRSAIVEAAYSGQVARHLFAEPIDTNLVPLGTLESEISQHANFNANTTANEYGLGLGNLNQNLVPYPQFLNSIQTAFARTATANYNAFYLTGTEHLAAGLTLLSSFSWSKSMDNDSSGELDGIVTDTFGFAAPQNPFAPNAGEYSYSTFDIPVHWTGAYVWDLPVGRGQLFNVQSRLLDAVVGGWETAGIFSAESGYPIWTTLGTAGYFISTAPGGPVGGNGTAIPTGVGAFNIRPNIVPGQPLLRANWKSDPYGLAGGGYLNPAAFAVPGSVNNPQFGDAPRTLGGARNPRTIYFDASVKKAFSIASHERVKLVVKMDAINAFNHTNFFFNPNSGHNLSGSINNTTGVYTQNSGFGDLSSGSQSPGRTFAVGANLTF